MASDFRLEFNDGWEDDLGRQVRREFQEVFDVVFRDYRGQPVPAVKDALTREFKRRGATLTDPELTTYATAISEGAQIRVRAA
jgi:hypothetical protein